MNPSTSAAIATFVLAALPGVIVLEIYEFGRPRIRERNASRAFAVYLILSLLAWVVAAAILGANGRLGEVIDLASEPRWVPGHGNDLVDAYIALSWRLLGLAVALGLGLRLLISAMRKYAFRTVERVRFEPEPELSLAARVAVSLAASSGAWDALFDRLKHNRKAQIVHVRFRDGADAYGVFAGGGRADHHSDGQGLVLDAELIEQDGDLVQVSGSNGMYIAPDAIASIEFVDDPKLGRPSAQLRFSDSD